VSEGMRTVPTEELISFPGTAEKVAAHTRFSFAHVRTWRCHGAFSSWTQCEVREWANGCAHVLTARLTGKTS
jgi:hypothetical protein